MKLAGITKTATHMQEACSRSRPHRQRRFDRVKKKKITCAYNLNGDRTCGFFAAVPAAFVKVINALDSPNGMLSISALYPEEQPQVKIGYLGTLLYPYW